MMEILLIMWNTILGLCSGVVGVDMLYKGRNFQGFVVLVIAAFAVVSIIYLTWRLRNA